MDAEIGIIGLGTMGSMAAWQLSKAGVSVIGFEQFGLGHDRSAAGGETRLFRTAYKEGAQYIPLLNDAFRMWRQLEADSGNSLFNVTTGLIIGDPDLESMKNVLKSIEKFELAHEILSADDAKLRYPQHAIEPHEIVIVDKQSGYLRPQYAVLSALRQAEKGGARLLSHTPVEQISPVEGGVCIKTQEASFTVKKVLITAGPWSAEFIADFRDVLEVRRLVNAWFLPIELESFTDEHFPVFSREKAEGTVYGFPAVDGNMVKLGIFSSEKDRIEHAGALDKNVAVEELSALKKVAQQELPGLYSDPVRVNAYMEVYTKDKHPIIGPVPGYDRIVVMTGFSGHGFKLAPTMGKVAKELLLGELPSFPLRDFSPERFSVIT